MRRDPTLMESIRHAMRQAVTNLKTLKMARPDDDAEIARLLSSLELEINHQDEGAEPISQT